MGKKRKVCAHPLIMQMYNTRGKGEGGVKRKGGGGRCSSFTLCLYMSLVICKLCGSAVYFVLTYGDFQQRE
jgi:hypothetical protein